MLAGIAFKRLAGLYAIGWVIGFARRAARHAFDATEGAALTVFVRCAACLIERSLTNRVSGGTLAGTVDAWKPIAFVPAGAAVVRVRLEVGTDLCR